MEFQDCRHGSLEIQDSEKGVIAGYAATYGKVDDRPVFWVEGAFDRTAKAILGGQSVKMLWQHWSDEPVGLWTQAKVDDVGLWVSGQVAMTVQKASEHFREVSAGLVDGLSIGFTNTTEERDDETGLRRITDAEIPEASLVTFPAMGGARIKSVQAASLQDIREWEKFLRDAGLSRSAAKALLADGYAGLAQRDADDGSAELLASIRKLSATLNTYRRKAQ